MKKPSVPVTVVILDKEFRIACAPDERDDLIRASNYLSDKMREVRDSGRLIGLDRVAVMAALNIANELLQERAAGGGSAPAADSQQVRTRLHNLHQKVEKALNAGRQMEF